MSMIRRSQAQWLALFQSHHQSGLSCAQFCRENKLCPKYFSKRRQALGFTPKSKSVFTQVLCEDTAKADNVALTLTHGQATLIFTSLPDADFMARLLVTLR